MPPQRKAKWRPHVKGKLTKPREVFPDDGPNKATPEYLALVSPEPIREKKAPKNATTELESYISWKARMAASRRKNIREGIVELHKLKRQEDTKMAAISDAKQRKRAELLAADEPDDLILTLPTIERDIRVKTALQDPEREKRLKEVKQRWESMEVKSLQSRMEQIHEMYLNASSFILTEAQLERTVEDIFSVSVEGNRTPPPNIRTMLNDLEKRDNYYKYEKGTKLSALAGALTGGRFPKDREFVEE